MKGGKKKMEQTEVKRSGFKESCKVCGKEIIGFTENQVRYNLEIHKKAKHPSEQIENANQ